MIIIRKRKTKKWGKSSNLLARWSAVHLKAAIMPPASLLRSCEQKDYDEAGFIRGMCGTLNFVNP